MRWHCPSRISLRSIRATGRVRGHRRNSEPRGLHQAVLPPHSLALLATSPRARSRMFPTSVTYVAELGNSQVRWGEVIISSSYAGLTRTSMLKSCIARPRRWSAKAAWIAGSAGAKTARSLSSGRPLRAGPVGAFCPAMATSRMTAGENPHLCMSSKQAVELAIFIY